MLIKNDIHHEKLQSTHTVQYVYIYIHNLE